MIVKSNIRVAYLGNQISPGGGAMSLYLMVKSIPANQYDKLVFVSQCRSEEMKNDLKRYCNAIEIIDLDEIVSCQTYTISLIRFYKIRLFSKRKIQNLLKLLLENKIDILHINNSVFAHVCKYVKENSAIKIVSHVREMIHHKGIGVIQKYMINNIYKYSDAIITISNNEAEVFKGHSNLNTIPNPFDFSKIENVCSTFRRDESINEETIIVGMMGRFDKFKGHLDFLKALKFILENGLSKREFKFLIIGVNPPRKTWKILVKRILFMKDYRKEVETFICKNQLQNHVSLIPYSYHIFNIIKAVDVFVRPSKSGDPWGRDIIEAMAFSKPIIATGISQYYIKNNETGFLINPGDVIQMGNKITELINDQNKRISFGKEGYETIHKMCNISVFSGSLKKIYQELI
jgi:glycosyltransferase involved in cell wall biosynthesis